MNVKGWLVIAVGFLLSVIIILVLQSQLTKQKARAETAESLSKQRQEAITDMQTRQRDVAALDAQYTKELADAQASIDQLHSDVVAGRKRLQLNATCQKQSTTGTASMDDAARAGLTDAAERDYFTLRDRIETSGKMIAGLQQYIREQCIK
ncbi:lysis protein [Erwinia rhapontici]|uniref:lysis protein n=1 Tax=Erwinia rhapontici TaxID=55212 RepID=UPI0014385001|nr:lysis protein [Erwinia rhapontici]NKG30406.1 lysis protein [Erwinia rhapontici]